jgi:hypothetical protein
MLQRAGQRERRLWVDLSRPIVVPPTTAIGAQQAFSGVSQRVSNGWKAAHCARLRRANVNTSR